MQTYLPLEAQMNRNPEFKRNVWVEMTPGRMIAMPAIILVIMAAVSTASQSSNDPTSPMATTATWLYYALVFLWGTKLAADSIVDEVNSKTWIQQQMSPTSAWKMALGKLFGAPIYAWYGGLICLIIYVLSLTVTMPGGIIMGLQSAFTMLLSGVTVHAVAMSLALISLRKGRYNKKMNSTAIYLIAFISISYLFRLGLGLGTHLDVQSSWYGIETPYGTMDIFTSILCCYWAVIGLQRNMRTELQFENGMKTWYWFLATTTFYLVGFASDMHHWGSSVASHPEQSFSVPLLMGYYAFIYCGLLAFVLAFIEPKDAVTYRRLLRSYSQKDWKKINVFLPLWVPTLAVTGALAIITVIIGFASGDSRAFSDYTPPLYPLAIFAFVFRDIAFIMWLNALGRGKAPDTSAFVYLVLLHLVFPIMFSLGSISDHAASPMLAFFLPMPEGEAALSLAFGAIQAAIVSMLCVRAWQTRNETLEARFAVAAG